jgi:hypothetical protein
MDLLFLFHEEFGPIDLTPEITGKVEKVHAGCLDTVFVDLN